MIRPHLLCPDSSGLRTVLRFEKQGTINAAQNAEGRPFTWAQVPVANELHPEGVWTASHHV